jgi:hypothetical protein
MFGVGGGGGHEVYHCWKDAPKQGVSPGGGGEEPMKDEPSSDAVGEWANPPPMPGGERWGMM